MQIADIGHFNGGGIWLSYKEHSYFYIGQALLCLPFYAVGYYAKERIKCTIFNIRVFFVAFIIWVLTFILFYKGPQNISINLVSQPYPCFYIEAVAASVCVLELSKLIKARFLIWFGRNTLVPMLVQMAYISIISRYCIADNVAQYVIVAFIIVAACSLSIPLFNNKHYEILK